MRRLDTMDGIPKVAPKGFLLRKYKMKTNRGLQVLTGTVRPKALTLWPMLRSNNYAVTQQ